MVKENYLWFFTAACVFGLAAGFFLFGTWSGLFVSLLFVGMSAFLTFSLKRYNGSLWAGSRKYMVYILLLTASLSITANKLIIMSDFFGIIILMILFMYHQACNDEQWGFGCCLFKIMAGFLSPFYNIDRIVSDYVWYRRNKNINSVYIYIILGVVIAIPLTSSMMLILAFADKMFYDLMDVLIGGLKINISIGRIIYTLLAVVSVYGFFVFGYEMNDEGAVRENKRYQPVTAIVSYGILTSMYILFSMVQIAHIFVRNQDITYSSFAREGFFNLLFVAVINLGLVVAGTHFLRKNKILDLIMVIMSGCTYIMIISAAVRIFIYIRAYELSILRYFVIWAIIVVAVIFAGVIKKIFDAKFRLLSYVFNVFTVMFIILSFSRPDYVVAKYNLTNLDKEDFEYIECLSLDAVPAVVGAGERMAEYDYENYCKMMKNLHYFLEIELENDFAKYNLSEAAAQIMLGNVR